MTEPVRPGWQRTAARFLPILDWAPTYDRTWLRADIIAGLTVAALVVPKSLGYAGIAKVPIEHGLYAAAAGAIIYALFGTSRQIATNPSSSLAAVAASALVLSGLTSPEESVAFVSAIALVSGLLFLVMTILRMGWISQFISRPVIVGFLCGAALDVTVGELNKLTGTEASGDNSWQEFWSWISGLGSIHWTSLLVGGLSLIALFGLRAVAPKLPGTLVVVVGGLLVSVMVDLEARGVALVGNVPRGVPSFEIPDLDLLLDHAGYIGVAALAIVMIGFSQTTGNARAFATKHHYRVDINQESLAQGAANIGAGLFQGIPVSTSLSASSLNDRAGAKSQVASLVTGGVVILTMLAFAPLFSDLPTPVLGAVIIEAVIMGMIDVPELRRMFHVKRTDFWIAVAAIIGVIVAGVLAGIVIGIILSVGWLVQTVTSPAMPILGRERGTHVFHEIELYPDAEQLPGLLVVGLDGGLFFATAEAVGDRFREQALARDPVPATIVLDCRTITHIDSQGSAQLRELHEFARVNGISFHLARLKPQVMEVLDRDGITEEIGAANIHTSLNDAVRAHLAGTQRATV